MLSDNREFYDLCRKYKYYYNAYKEIEHLKNIYWSKYIQNAYNDVKKELEDVENKIIFKILDEIISDQCNIQVERNFRDNCNYDFFTYEPLIMGEKLTIEDPKFIKKLEEFVEHKAVKIL